MKNIESVKLQLCQQAWVLAEPCDPGRLTRMFQTGSPESPLTIHPNFTIQSGSAMAYILAVALFYICLVLLLVGTNFARTHQERMGKKEHVVEFKEGAGTTSRISGKGSSSSKLPPDIVDI